MSNVLDKNLRELEPLTIRGQRRSFLRYHAETSRMFTEAPSCAIQACAPVALGTPAPPDPRGLLHARAASPQAGWRAALPGPVVAPALLQDPTPGASAPLAPRPPGKDPEKAKAWRPGPASPPGRFAAVPVVRPHGSAGLVPASPGRAPSQSPAPSYRPGVVLLGPAWAPHPVQHVEAVHGVEVPISPSCSPACSARIPPGGGATRAGCSAAGVPACSATTTAAEPVCAPGSSVQIPVTVQASPAAQARPAAPALTAWSKAVQAERVGLARQDVDPEALREKLERIQQEVHSIAEKQKPPPDDLDTTRLAMDEIAGTLEHAQRQCAEAKAAEEALGEQLAASDHQLQDLRRRCQDPGGVRSQGVEREHALARQSLSQTARELDAAAATKDTLEEELKNIQRANEKTRTGTRRRGGARSSRAPSTTCSSGSRPRPRRRCAPPRRRPRCRRSWPRCGGRPRRPCARRASAATRRRPWGTSCSRSARSRPPRSGPRRRRRRSSRRAARGTRRTEAERLQQAHSGQIRQLWELEHQLRDGDAGRTGLSPGALLKAPKPRREPVCGERTASKDAVQDADRPAPVRQAIQRAARRHQEVPEQSSD
ncbi:unnamed protein product [Prorocentrum cordatum]|uniref:Uncharacterized protein n=1 Tax=Prorocentrum cordatum TaxID=2364126 RepID=A0ABN9T5L6_9DINO|nr:unnamed protein product [Polarella glacialis]